METTKQPTATPWLPLADENSQFCLAQTGRGVLTRIEGDHAGDRIVGITETDFRHAMACVNACAGMTTSELEAKQADHAEKSEGGYLADVETRLEHADRELAHRSAALFERQGCVLSVMDELKQAVEARLAAEAELNALKEMQANTRLIAEDQRDRLLGALELLLCDVEEAEYMTGREREAEARAVIAQVKGGAE